MCDHDPCEYLKLMKMSIIFPFLESMILLGSIERCELQAAFDWWLSAERRVYNRGEGVPSPGSQVSWESFAFVDEEVGEENGDKVRLILSSLI